MNYQKLHAAKLTELAKGLGITPARKDTTTGRTVGITEKDSPQDQLEAFTNGLAQALPAMITAEAMASERAASAEKVTQLEAENERLKAEHELDLTQLTARMESAQ